MKWQKFVAREKKNSEDEPNCDSMEAQAKMNEMKWNEWLNGRWDETISPNNGINEWTTWC